MLNRWQIKNALDWKRRSIKRRRQIVLVENWKRRRIRNGDKLITSANRKWRPTQKGGKSKKRLTKKRRHSKNGDKVKTTVTERQRQAKKLGIKLCSLRKDSIANSEFDIRCVVWLCKIFFNFDCTAHYINSLLISPELNFSHGYVTMMAVFSENFSLLWTRDKLSL